MAAGDFINTLDGPASVHAFNNTLLTGLSNTTYNQGTPAVNLTFIAPNSGRVLVAVSAGLRSSSGANRINLAAEIRENDISGAIVQPASVSVTGFSNAPVGTALTQFGCRIFVAPMGTNGFLPSLTPGGTYFARVMYQVTAGATCDVRYRGLTVVPSPLGTHYGAAGDLALTLQRPQVERDLSTRTQLNIASGIGDRDYGFPEIATEFIAPASGRALIVVGGGIRDNTNAGRGAMTVEVREDGENGQLLFDPESTISGLANFWRYAWTSSGTSGVTAYQYGSAVGFLGDPATEPLVPGRTYFVRVIQLSDGSATVDIFNRQLYVIPVS